MNLLSQFGIDPLKFAIQSLIFLLPTIWATMRVIKYRDGIQLAGWVFVVWFLPVFGSILALLIVKTPKIQRLTSQST
jgi:hypothetical protein